MPKGEEVQTWYQGLLKLGLIFNAKHWLASQKVLSHDLTNLSTQDYSVRHDNTATTKCRE